MLTIATHAPRSLVTALSSVRTLWPRTILPASVCVALLGAPAAAAATDALRGVTRFMVTLGIPPTSDPPGSPCGVAHADAERFVLEALRAAGAEEVWHSGQLLALVAAMVERRETINRTLREGRPLPPDTGARSEERLAALEEANSRPFVAVNLSVRAAIAPGQPPGSTPALCALAARINVRASLPSGQTAGVGATGREARHRLLLWEGGVHLALIPPGPGYAEAVRAELDRALARFFADWQAQNRSSIR